MFLNVSDNATGYSVDDPRFNTTGTGSGSGNKTGSFDGFLELNDSQSTARRLILVVLPILVLCGTAGNLVSLFVLRTGQLKVLSTCFYMSVLALAETGG